MKKTFYLLLATFFAFSCSEEDVKKLAEISTDVNLNKTLSVNIPENSPTLTFTTTEEADASDTGIDVTKVEFKSIKGEIKNVVAPTTVNLTTSSISLDGTGVSWSLPQIPLVAGLSVELTFDDITTAEREAIAAYVLANEKLDFTASATVDGAPVSFDIILNVELKVTGTP